MQTDATALPGKPGPRERRTSRVLVTGASGYLGSNIVGALLADSGVGEVVAGVRDAKAGEALLTTLGGPERLTLRRGLLPDDPWSLDGIDALVHVAGVRPGIGVDDTRILLVNQEGTRRLLERVPGSGVARVVYVSALSVYGWERPPPWRETMAPRPQTAYGISKWVGEFLCRGLSENVGVAVLRLARVYGLGVGHRLAWTRMPHRFALLAARGETIPIFGTGEQRLDLVHVEDVAEAVRRAAVGPGASRRSVLNVGGGQPVATRRLAELCVAAAGQLGLSAPAVTSVPQGGETGPDFGLDIGRARRILGWEPQRELADGLRELVAAAGK